MLSGFCFVFWGCVCVVIVIVVCFFLLRKDVHSLGRLQGFVLLLSYGGEVLEGGSSKAVKGNSKLSGV
jgi:hypothetical protein